MSAIKSSDRINEAVDQLKASIEAINSEFEREKKRLGVAANITKLIGDTLIFDQVAKKALRATIDFLSNNDEPVVGTFQWLDLKTMELVDIAGIGYKDGQENIRVPLGKGITGRVAETGEALLIKDVTELHWKELYIDVMAGDMRSELAVPLARDGEIWGVLNVESPKLAAFDENDKLLLQTIADQVMIALRNAQKHSEIERERDRFKVAAEVTGLVLGNTIGFKKEADRALAAVVKFLSTDERKVVGTLQRLNPKTKELVDVAGVGYEEGREDVRVRLGEGVTGRVAKTGKPLLIDDLADEKWKDIYIDVMAGDMRSELAVPLKREKKVWGVLNVESPDLKAFDENDKLLLQMIADQIMIALRTAEEQSVLERERDRFKVAAEVTGLVLGNTIGFKKEAAKALAAAVKFLSTNERKVVGTLQRLDLKTKELIDVAGVGYEEGREDVRVRLGEGVTGRVAKTGRPLLIYDLADEKWKDIYVDVMAGDMRSELAVPLKREKKVWGVLNVESPDLDAFDKNDKLLLQTIADQIMIALRTAEVHEQILTKEKLEGELQVARKIQESINPSVLPKFRGFDFGARTIPARAMGGDIYDFIELDRDTLGILIGDVVDKGVSASIFMAITKGLVRALATPHLSPKELLLAVNHHLYE
ncbi:MAG: GAF domain-containing protein, partial [Ignavibacterium sp.]|nr:GAF domain-containing protein [Ignavibacterium sp.]